MTPEFGVLGLGVMGANLARNIASRGVPVVGFDVDANKRSAFLRAAADVAAQATVADTARALLGELARPRRIIAMVPAGPIVDQIIQELRPLLDRGDVLIDAGNSYFKDTDRRADELERTGVHFLGTGVSGGEDGALRGPAIMPGGPREAWELVAPVFRAMAARADNGEPCVEYMGPRGAGHYVKMVHNGIEYGDMQLIAEVYDLLTRGAGLDAAGAADLFEEWNRGDLRSYLVEITAHVLRRTDEETGKPLVDLILDEAQQKGTGKWMSQNAFDVGAAIPTVNAAVEARLLSALKPQRLIASARLVGPSPAFRGDRHALVEAARAALYASKVASYAQGMALLQMASAEYGYAIDPGLVAKIWRAGCIIRAALLEDIRAAYAREATLANLMLADRFRDALAERQGGWRHAVTSAIDLGIPVPALAASLAYYDAYRSGRLPANLTQAQRDYFGAHTYRRVDRDGIFHTDWHPVNA